MAQGSDLLTVAEVAARLRVSDETVHRWAREGSLPYVPLPSGTKRFRREDIEAIETRRVTSTKGQ
jgi:excisionase family DNA binding protein